MDTSLIESKSRLLVVLTVRIGSERLRGKVVALIQGKPLFVHIAERYASISNAHIVVATTQEPEDDTVVAFCNKHGLHYYRHKDSDDVMGRIEELVTSDYDYCMRALGDCPFIETSFVIRAMDVLDNAKAHAFLWFLMPEIWPVYGAREYPYPIATWRKMFSYAERDEREHTDMYLNRNRGKFKFVYHEPPPPVYFRNYRLEVDYKEDLELVKAVAKGVGMQASLPKVIKFLDANPAIANLNRGKIEKTGPMVSHSQQDRRQWFKAMKGQPVVGWDNEIWKPQSNNSKPIMCKSNQCHIGYFDEGVLYLRDGSQIHGRAYINCQCGQGVFWHNDGSHQNKWVDFGR